MDELVLVDDIDDTSVFAIQQTRMLKEYALWFSYVFDLKPIFIQNDQIGLNFSKTKYQDSLYKFFQPQSRKVWVSDDTYIWVEYHFWSGSLTQNILHIDDLLNSQKPKANRIINLGSMGGFFRRRLSLGKNSMKILKFSKYPVLLIGPSALKKKRWIFKRLNQEINILLLTNLDIESLRAEGLARRWCQRAIANGYSVRLTLMHSLYDDVLPLGLSWLSAKLKSKQNDFQKQAHALLEAKVNSFKKKNISTQYTLELEEKSLKKSLGKLIADSTAINKEYDFVIARRPKGRSSATLRALDTNLKIPILEF